MISTLIGCIVVISAISYLVVPYFQLPGVYQKSKDEELLSTQIKVLQNEVAALTLCPPKYRINEEIMKLLQPESGCKEGNPKECVRKRFIEQMFKQLSENADVQKILQKQCGPGQNLLGDVEKLIGDYIRKYDADKIGEADYALQSLGGAIVSHSCKEVVGRKVELTLLGLPIYSLTNGPDSIIQPNVHPGECFPIGGSEASFTIKLAGVIQVSGFTLEHIPRSLSPSGQIDSAPKNFRVLGLKNERDHSGACLGTYMYDINGPPLQTFKVQMCSPPPFGYVKLEILSNHGNPKYTCVYRFRVHGTLANAKLGCE